MRLIAALAGLLLASLVGGARAETLVLSLSTSRVSITSNYTGSSVVVFGAIERDAQSMTRAGNYDIVVTVRGPRGTGSLREKEKAGLIWLNRDRRRYPDVPTYLAVLATEEPAKITTDNQRKRLRIGLDAIVDGPDFAPGYNPGDPVFRDALIRLFGESDLYVQNPRGVTFLTPNLFRAAIPLPATAPPGNYEVEAVLFSSQAMLARAETHFELVKQGFEQRAAVVAREWSGLYGISVAAMALLFGWLATVIFRRD